MKIKTEEDARNAEMLIEKVRMMRGAQKRYFSSRDYMMLQHAKTLEKEVDEQLDYWEVRDMMAEQRKRSELFPAT